MAKQAYVYSGTDWVPLASEVTNLTAYQTKALAQAPYRNLIINGDMQVAQRGTSTASITTAGYRTADRWNTDISSLGTWTQSVENDAPTGSGFRKSLKMLCTTADASPAASDYLQIVQKFEGQNLQGIKKGTAAAEQLTLSFWVKSNVTGTYIARLYDEDNNRLTSKSYTISSSATWEYKTITFAADTTGAFDNDNASSLTIAFWLAGGSNFTSGSLANSWATYSAANEAPGQTNLASATNNYWQVTGVQLEVGDTATPFEFKPFDEDLRECQRYYYRVTAGTSFASFAYGVAIGGADCHFFLNLPTAMRVPPTSYDYSALRVTDFAATNYTITTSSLVTGQSSLNTAYITTTGSSGMTGYRPMGLVASNNAAAYVGVSAEL